MAKQNLDNQWSKLLSTGTYDGETYTTADLDKMVDEYGKREDADKAPVGLGTPLEGRPEIVGRIDALRRNGDSVEGMFSNIDPRVEHLSARGVFAKKSVQINRSPAGKTLQRVGLVSPVWDGTIRRDDKTPSLDDLVKQNLGPTDHIFAEAPLAGQWLELFRTGDYGSKGNFTNADLDQVVSNFDPSFHEPPAVIGHPEHDAPAYAWVDGLKRQGELLMGKLKLVHPQFEEMVKSGRFKKRSVSLYQTGKGLMLRHVGFLGAQPPEIKGLKDATFKEDRMRFITVTFGDSASDADAAIARLKQGGYWLPHMDRIGFAEMFRSLEGNPLLDRIVTLIEFTEDELGVDPGGARLSQRAKNYARFHGVSFSEALDQVQLRGEQDRAVANQISAGVTGAALTQRARSIERSRGVNFGEALSMAAEENPELLLS